MRTIGPLFAFALATSSAVFSEPEAPKLDPAVGTWAWGGGKTRFIIEKDGSVTHPGRSGTWKAAGNGKYVLRWAKERPVDTLVLTADRLEMSGGNQFGKKLRIVRIGAPPPPDALADAFTPDRDGFRLWTEADTGKQFVGRIITTKLDGSSAQIVRKDNGKSFWIDTSSLSPADQFYIRYWVDPQEQVKARVVASGHPGWKKVKVIIKAGPESLLVRVTGQKPPPDKVIAGLPRPPFTRIVATGETLEFEFGSGTKYAVEATANSRLTDAEADDKKTGL